MPHLLQSRGEAVLADVMRRAPLLAFDFDGTLAPIVARPEQARVSECVAGKLRRLAHRLPVAIVTGRAVADVRDRLGFAPRFIVGNHGAEFEGRRAGPVASLQPVRARIGPALGRLEAAGVTVEDKGCSLALHYRLARDPSEARGVIRSLLQGLEEACSVFPGKMVENVVPHGAPDKWQAVQLLAGECGAGCGVFVGDDVNDEPVFAGAPGDWLTVRVGRDDPESRARFFLGSVQEVGLLLDRMLMHLAEAQ